jgi:TatD DNase family protein
MHAKAFARDRETVLERVWESGVRFLVEVNITPNGWPLVSKMAAEDPRIFATVGIHPHDTGQAEFDELERLFEEIGAPKVVAIGETGLDYYRNYAPHEVQRQFFRRHVEVARLSGLPLVVHARAAHEDVLRILEEEGRGDVYGVLHCFSGDLAIARRAGELNFYLGFGGAITYNPRKSAPLLRAIGLDRMVLETDCPYLTPHPHRKERNDPSYIPTIAEAMAGFLEIGVDEVEQVTDANAVRLFGLPE